ncbi:MAG TPA: ABC transporter substrate-binding protein [Thermoanaerobaculia bacterium]|nr:ABC transporter substrate-binding protein [Thermoanaerobaculia bacterium]
MRRIVFPLLGLLLGAGATRGEDLSEAEQRGRAFYRTGVAADGAEVLARLAGGGAEVPAATLPCSSCHGWDGRGRPEGSVEPSNITWAELTKPYEVGGGRSRKRPPYDERLLKRAITLGVDSAGQPLTAVMPRYQLTHEQAADLVSYLKRLEGERDPGVGDEELVLGVVLPAEPAAARAVETLLTTSFERVNQAGGVFGRRLRLASLAASAGGDAQAEALERFVGAEKPFALVAPHLSGAEQEVADLCGRLGLPAVGAAAADPALEGRGSRYVFYLTPGPTALVGALADWWKKHQPTGRKLLVVEGNGEGQAWTRELVGRLGPAAETEVLSLAVGVSVAAVPARAREMGATAVVLLATGEEGAAVFDALAALPELPLLAPGVVAARLLVAGDGSRRGKVITTLPVIPQDLDPKILPAVGALAGISDPRSPGFLEARSAFAAVNLLLEGLRRVGRDLRREKLVEALETIYELPTGVMQPLGYGPTRRVGVGSVWAVEVDLATGQPVGEPELLPIQ